MGIREMASYVIMGGISLLLVQQNCTIRSLEKRLSKQEQLETQPYQLPDDVVTIAELEGHVLKIVSRIGGDTTYVVTERYIPPESGIEYIVRTDTLAMEQLEAAQLLLWQLQQRVMSPEDSIKVDSLASEIERLRRQLATTEVNYRSHGFCAYPELGVGLDSEIRPNIEAGTRLYYLGRFGAGIHGAAAIPVDSTQEWDGSIGLFGDYRIPDWDNSAIFGSLDYGFRAEQFKVMAGLQVYLK